MDLRFRPLFSLIVAAMCATGAAKAQSSHRNETANPLQLSAVVLDQHYCDRGHEFPQLIVTLRLSFRNASSDVVIVARDGYLVGGVDYYANRADAEARKPSTQEIDDWMFGSVDPSQKPVVPAKPGTGFVILQPGASFETETEMRLIVVQAPDHVDPTVLAAGEHFMSVGVFAYLGDSDYVSEARERWVGYGKLLTSGATSEPFSVTVEQGFKLVSCPD
jgi:hypothetical protein